MLTQMLKPLVPAGSPHCKVSRRARSNEKTCPHVGWASLEKGIVAAMAPPVPANGPHVHDVVLVEQTRPDVVDVISTP